MGPTDERTTGVFQCARKMIPTTMVSTAPKEVNASSTMRRTSSHFRKSVFLAVHAELFFSEYCVGLQG